MGEEFIMFCPCCAREVKKDSLWVEDGLIYHYSCYNQMMAEEDEDSEQE